LTPAAIYVPVLFMSTLPDTAAEEALLMELAQLGMGLARQVQQVAVETTEATPLVALATAFHHLSRGVRQSLALRARFAAGTVATEGSRRNEAAAPAADTERPDHIDRPERDETERPDWHTRLPAIERLEALHPDDDVNRARITRDLTVVSRNPALAAIPALRAPAAALAGRAALLTGASLRRVNSS
jgi:hypothetical protein